MVNVTFIPRFQQYLRHLHAAIHQRPDEVGSGGGHPGNLQERSHHANNDACDDRGYSAAASGSVSGGRTGMNVEKFEIRRNKS